jgi:hypothetical protein
MNFLYSCTHVTGNFIITCSINFSFPFLSGTRCATSIKNNERCMHSWFPQWSLYCWREIQLKMSHVIALCPCCVLFFLYFFISSGSLQHFSVFVFFLRSQLLFNTIFFYCHDANEIEMYRGLSHANFMRLHCHAQHDQWAIDCVIVLFDNFRN